MERYTTLLFIHYLSSLNLFFLIVELFINIELLATQKHILIGNQFSITFLENLFFF